MPHKQIVPSLDLQRSIYPNSHMSSSIGTLSNHRSTRIMDQPKKTCFNIFMLIFATITTERLAMTMHVQCRCVSIPWDIELLEVGFVLVSIFCIYCYISTNSVEFSLATVITYHSDMHTYQQGYIFILCRHYTHSTQNGVQWPLNGCIIVVRCGQNGTYSYRYEA